MAFPGAPRGPHGHRNSVADFRPHDSPSQQASGGRQRGTDASVTPHANGSGFGGSMHRRGGPAQGSNGAIFTREPTAGTKNTSHVPCKFFMAGNCQAGKACPFSHAAEAFNHPPPCKYFAKGNCKYGYKCANPHLLPDGSDARRATLGRQQFHRDQFSIGPPAQAGYTDPMPQQPWSPAQPSSPLLATNREHYPIGMPTRTFDNLSINDTMYNTGQLQYGSPPDPNHHLPISPAVRALDATLPPTFDSEGASNLAFEGPFPASLPSRFGFGYSPPTVSTALSTAFANLDLMTKVEMNGSSNRAPNLGSSPPVEADSKISGKRLLHSERLRQTQPVASSLPMPRPNMRPVRIRSSDESSDDEINLLPDVLSDIMTPEEKRRRFSRNDEDDSIGASQSLSRFGSPSDSKFGSPSNASPSGFGPLFARKQREDNHDAGNLGSSPYGSIGEHLRNTSLSATISPSLRPIARPENSRISGDISPFGMSSPPDRRPGGALSMLSQQFNSLRMNDTSGSSPRISSSPPQVHSNGVRSHSVSGHSYPLTAGRSTRDVSNNSIVVRSDRIDEEPSIFEMDEHEEDTRKREVEKQSGTSDQHKSLPWNASRAEVNDDSGESSPGLGPRHSGTTGA